MSYLAQYVPILVETHQLSQMDSPHTWLDWRADPWYTASESTSTDQLQPCSTGATCMASTWSLVYNVLLHVMFSVQRRELCVIRRTITVELLFTSWHSMPSSCWSLRWAARMTPSESCSSSSASKHNGWLQHVLVQWSNTRHGRHIYTLYTADTIDCHVCFVHWQLRTLTTPAVIMSQCTCQLNFMRIRKTDSSR